MRRAIMGCLGVVLASCVLFISTDAYAQEGNVIELEQSVYQGERHAPEAFYILDHAELEYERLDAEDSFVVELLESVDQPPF